MTLAGLEEGSAVFVDANVFIYHIQAIPAMQIEITPVTEATILLSLRHQRRYGLLTNDSLIVASMQQQGVRPLATADRRLAIVGEIDIRPS